MKNKIVLYLFIFSVLMLLFMYMNQKRIYEDQETKINQLTEKSLALESELDSLKNVNFDLNYFTLLGNDNAMTYFENFGLEAGFMEQLVSEHLYAQNQGSEDNPLVPYTGTDGSMKINKVRFLNHRWIIADFTDGTNWGELILEYELDENQDLTLRTIASMVYPPLR
ncbi:hypothetical protein [uncultured Planktosalinus sp.]|uniref:hypothetical protein n=1 Tax=uncultured Planktosalinus sp. TaxID=1810935 RepID=UPI0030D9C9CD